MHRQRLLFVSEALDASPTRYRALAYFDRLRAAGWHPAHITVTGLWRRVALARAVRDADIIVVLRKAFSPAFCRILRRGGRKLVFDVDDALFTSDDGADSVSRTRRFHAMATASDMIWAGNDYLASHAANDAPAIVLPTSIDLQRYSCPPAPDPHHFDIAWIGSSATRKYLETILPTLAQAAQHIPRLRLKIIADFDLPTAHALGLPTLAVPWSAETEAVALASAHVGIAPLPDDPWTRGKCGLKIIQCMAAGLPVIASPVAAQAAIIDHDRTGILAATPADWLAALQHLHKAPSLRTTMGAAARTRAATHYSLDATFPKMISALHALRPRLPANSENPPAARLNP